MPYEKLRAGDFKGSYFLVARCFFFRQGKVQGNLEAPSSEVLWPQGPAGLHFVFLIFLLRRETGRGPGHGEVEGGHPAGECAYTNVCKVFSGWKGVGDLGCSLEKLSQT